MNKVIDLQDWFDKRDAAIELIRQQEAIERHVNVMLSDFLHEIHQVMNYYRSVEFITDDDLEKILLMAIKQRKDGIIL